MTLAEFSNELCRLHCIDAFMVPELSEARGLAFVRNPVQFFIHADDATQKAIWDAMERDRRRFEAKP